MNCCTPEITCNVRETDSQVSKRENCANCGTQSRAVSRKTVLLMLKPQVLEQAFYGKYRFCATPNCSVVYFEEESDCVFTTDDLQVIVGVKSITDPIPLCYCFGFEERHLRLEISQTGSTSIPERISNLIREGLCACEARNPSGVCCLGDVNQAAKRLRQEQSKISA